MTSLPSAAPHIVPLFIGGCPRSGTTLLASLLDTDNIYVVTPESPFKRQVLIEFAESEPRTDRLISVLKAMPKFTTWSLDLGRDGELHGQLRVASNPAEFLVALVRAFAQRSTPSPGDPAKSLVWVDHTPDNLLLISELHACFADARFVHLVRDGRAIAASHRNTDWGPMNAAAAANMWNKYIAAGLSAEFGLSRERLFRIRYEDLVMRAGHSIDQVKSRLTLPSGQFRRSSSEHWVPDYTRSQHALVGSPLDPTRINAWTQVLSQREVEIFEAMTAETLTNLGYPLNCGSTARPRSTVETVRQTLTSAARWPARRFRNHRRSRLLRPSKRGI